MKREANAAQRQDARQTGADQCKFALSKEDKTQFNAAMRWELIPYQLNPMSLVRVKTVLKDSGNRKHFPWTSFESCLSTFPSLSEPCALWRCVWDYE